MHLEGGSAVICPTYFKSIKVHNKSGEEFNVKIATQSGKHVVQHVKAGQHKQFAEKTHSEGCQFVDPITSFEVARKSHPADLALKLTQADAHLIDCRQYEIRADFSVHRL